MADRKPAVLKVRDLLQDIPTELVPVHLRPTLLAAATYADPDGSSICMSAATLGRMLGRARSTISDHLQQLDRLHIVKPTGPRKSWGPNAHTRIRYVDFAVLNGMAADGSVRQPTSDELERQSVRTNDGEVERLTSKEPASDGLGQNNLPNHSYNQPGGNGDDVEPSPPSRREVAERIAKLRGDRPWEEVIAEGSRRYAMPSES